MSKRKDSVPEVIRALLASQGKVSAGEVARLGGFTRQAAHYHLSRMVKSGELAGQGAGPTSRYVRRAVFAATYPLAGLEEHVVWREVEAALSASVSLSGEARSILAYSFTEMLNNAIEHSAGRSAVVLAWHAEGNVAFQVTDDGVGVFEKVRATYALTDEFEAISHLSKGKQTSDAARHSGEGIFFTSKAVDMFELESDRLTWTVDNLRGDQAVGGPPSPRKGTRVACRVARDSNRSLTEVFERFTQEQSLGFSRTSVPVRLLLPGGSFVSRSEAKRLAVGLDRFREVVVDFSGVTEIGQAFVDELFRVWAQDHPRTELIPQAMTPAVEAMIERGLTGMDIHPHPRDQEQPQA